METVSFGQRVFGVPLRGSSDVAFSFMCWYRITAAETGRLRWDTPTVGYLYEFTDVAGRELVAFHWHPDSRSPITFPHVHIGARIGDLDLSKLHIPTGVLKLPQIIRFAIEEVGVEPLREDWRAALGIT
jgi:hypothetical protein